MANAGGANETYMAVPVAHERSPSAEAAMMTTGQGISARTVRAIA
jgi:hypothetical protein